MTLLDREIPFGIDPHVGVQPLRPPGELWVSLRQKCRVKFGWNQQAHRITGSYPINRNQSLRTGHCL